MDTTSIKNKNLVDIRQSPQYANYLKSQGWKVERINNINYFIKKVPLIGSVLKLQRPRKIDLSCIDVLIHRYKLFQIIVEPINNVHYSQLINHGFKLSRSPFLPTKTMHIDLTCSVKQITAGFSKDTRYSIRRGEGVKVKPLTSVNDLEKFHKAWKNGVKFTRVVPSLQSLINLRKSFPMDHSLFLTSHNINNEIIGGAIFTLSSHDIAYYWYGFTNSEGRTSLSQYSLLYQGILWAKRMGCKVFDMEGVYDKRFPQKSWLGFSHFKKGFGGQEVLYPRCFTRTYLSNIFHHFQ